MRKEGGDDLKAGEGLAELFFSSESARDIPLRIAYSTGRYTGFDLALLSKHLCKEGISILDGAGTETFTTENFSIHTSRLRELSSKRTLQYLAREIIRGRDSSRMDEHGRVRARHDEKRIG